MMMGTRRNRSPLTHGLGLLLAGLVTITLPLALALSAVHSQLFSPERVKELVTQEFVVSGALREVIVISLVTETDAGQEGVQQLTAEMDPSELEQLAEVLVPDVWLEAQIGAAVDDLYVWLDSERTLPVIELDMEPLREHLLTGGAEQAVDIVMSSWPPCMQSQVEVIATEALQAGGAIPLLTCLPPEPYQTLIKEQLVLRVSQEVEAMPSSQSLIGADVDPGAPAEYGELKSGLRTLRWLGGWSWMVPVGLLGLTMAVAVRSAPGWALWWGIPLLGGGVLSLLLSLALQGPAEAFLIDIVAQIDIPASFRRALQAALMNVADSVHRRWLFSGMLVTGGGGVLSLLAWILPPRGS